MKSTSIGEVIASRELEFTGSDGTVRQVEVCFGKPVQEADGPWFCPYQIKSQVFEKQFRVVGEDSMQSLLLALKIVAVELEVFARDYKGTFTWFGGEDLGFK